jgi:hypothetical protein
MKEYSLPEKAFFTVHAWMIKELKLKGNELIVYAVIWGFTHDMETKFLGGIKYLCAITNSGKTNIIFCLKSLKEKGLIDRVEIQIGNLVKHSYFITNKTSCSESEPGSCSESEPGSCSESEPGSCSESEPGSCSESEPGSCSESEPLEVTDIIIDKKKGRNVQLSPSNSFSNLPSNSNSLSVGTKDLPSPSPSNTPQPPDIKTLGVKMCDLLRKRMRSEMDDILSRTELDLPTLSEMFAEYWVYNKGREFDSKNWKGIKSSFQKWFDVGGSKELPTKEISNGIKGKTIMEEIIEIVRKKKGIEMTSDEATAVKKFLAETILTDEQLKMEVTRRFLMGGGTTWKTWLSIAANVHSEEMYHKRLNGKV